MSEHRLPDPDTEHILVLRRIHAATAAQLATLPYSAQLQVLRGHVDANHGASLEQVPPEGWVP